MTKVLIIISIIITAILIYCNAGTNVGAPVDYIAVGDSITKRSFDTLSKTVQGAIATRGIEGAIDFCSEKALDLTALYGRNDITIGRTSLKVRNKANAPTTNDVVQLDYFARLAANGEPLHSKLVADYTGMVHYYKPIILQPQCLNCHGTPGIEINSQTLQAINAKYPEDEAIGYAVGDLRGLWHITFSINEKKNKR